MSQKQTARAFAGALVAVLAALAPTPAVAAASSVAVEGGALVPRAAPGEQNRVTVGPDDSDALVQIGDAGRPSYPADVCAPAMWNLDAVCAVRVVRIRSAVRRGRVVKLSPRAGRKVRAGAKVKVYVSRGKARRATASAVARASEYEVVSPAPRVLKAVKVRCVKLLRGGRACGKRFKDDWKRGWWSDPAKFEIVEAAFYGDTEMTVPFDDYKSFRGEGYTSIKAAKGFRGTLKLPRRGALVPATPLVAKPAAWTMRSIGAWTTTSGTFGCNVDRYPSPPTSIAGVVSADTEKGTIGIQWTLWPAGFACKGEGSPPNPDFPGLPSEAMSVRYKASAFRNAELIKLPVSIEWEGVRESDGTRLKLDWTGRVVLRRIHHRL